MLHNSLDELLQYDCWLASDDVRYLATGLGFGAVKNHSLIGAAFEAYKSYSYPSGTNVIRDTKIFERELPEWKKSDRSQVLRDNILLIGYKDYGKWAKHLYTYTWADVDTMKQREKELIEAKKTNLISWKVKCAVRSPQIINFFDKRKGTKIEKIYTFMAYDLLDNGAIYYIKRLRDRMFKKR